MNRFLVAFGTEGGESVINLSDMEDEFVIDKLTSDDGLSKSYDKFGSAMNMLALRFRANNQRHIETYLLDVDEAITEEDIWDMFEASPQYTIDMIRQKGVMLKHMSFPAPFDWTISRKKDPKSA